MNEHVGDIDIARFRAGKLDRERVEAIGAHVRDCPSCAARVWASRDVRDAAEAVVRNASAPRTRVWWIAAAAVLAIIGGIVAYAVWHSSQRASRIPVIVKRPVPPPEKHPWDALVADALRSGELEPPPTLRELRHGAGEVVRGPDEDGREVLLLAPVGLGVESQTPQFRWTRVSGSCEVTVVRNGEVVAKSGRITSTSWTPPAPLARDARYEWQLTMEKNGHRTRVPPPEESAARFRVISEEEARLLAAARASGDPIATGIIAARAGVIDEAVTQLSRSSDARARALAEKIRHW